MNTIHTIIFVAGMIVGVAGFTLVTVLYFLTNILRRSTDKEKSLFQSICLEGWAAYFSFLIAMVMLPAIDFTGKTVYKVLVVGFLSIMFVLWLRLDKKLKNV